LFTSSELEEIVNLCDRTLAFYKGKILREFQYEEATKAEVMQVIASGATGESLDQEPSEMLEQREVGNESTRVLKRSVKNAIFTKTGEMDMLPNSVLLHGRDEPLPERIDLRAGPLNLIYENGDLRYIKYGDREVIRRIYVAIRDRNWGTILPIFSNVTMDIGSDSFRITYEVENKQGEVDFAWQPDPGVRVETILFSMDGAAAHFLENRIGFCILHPAFWRSVSSNMSMAAIKRRACRR
jgi:hypothetical protein